MPYRVWLRTSGRLISLLTMLCYVWVSGVLPFQHSDHIGEEIEGGAILTRSVRHVGRSSPHSSHVHAERTLLAARLIHSGPCLACQWQSAQVSSALPVCSFTLSERFISLCVVTTFPRYLPAVASTLSSRGPPLA